MSQLEEIQQEEERLRQAMLTRNLAELDRLLSDELLAVGPDGQMVTKEEDLAMHRTGQVTFHTLVSKKTAIKLLPEAAIVFMLMDMQVTFQGGHFAGFCRYTRIWSKQTGSWQIVGAHISPLPN